MNTKTTTTPNAAISYWLYGVCGLLFTMIIVGAITRLTDSGLSMVEWRPLLGALPPHNEAEWARVFELYKAYPEFEKQNFWMELDDFKAIFFWEWFHRLLGRLIGVVYALPLLWFWIRKQIPSGYKLKLLGGFILGGLQGLMGWYMVKSGLVDQPDVSHFRLAAHLSLALVIVAYLLWIAQSLKPLKPHPNAPLFRHGIIAVCAYTVTALWGAFTAGLDAGLIYGDTFPMMGDRIVPTELSQYDPLWLGLFESHAGVQFAHRWLAMGTGIIIFSLWAHAALKRNTFPALNVLALLIILQIGIGIGTLHSGVALPIATAHQATAVLILIALITSLKQLKPQ